MMYAFAGAPLHTAALQGDVAALKRGLAAGQAIDARAAVSEQHGLFWQELTPLMVAAYSCQGASAATVAWLLEHGATASLRSAGHVTAAWYAAGSGFPGEVEMVDCRDQDHATRLALLLDQGLDVNEQSPYEDSLLVRAAQVADAARVELLLRRGAALEPAVDLAAAQAYDKRIYDKLFAEADMPEEMAAQFRPPPVERPRQHLLPLFLAIQAGAADCVELLLGAGADPNGLDSRWQSPLLQARTLPVLELLLAYGADAQLTDYQGRDAIYYLLHEDWREERDLNESRKMLARLAAAGLSLDEPGEQPNTSRLHTAAWRYDVSALEMLLALGADPGIGRNPLGAACWHSSAAEAPAVVQTIAMLVAAGCDPNHRDEAGDTLLHNAAYPFSYSLSEANYYSSSDGTNVAAIAGLLAQGAEPDPAGVRGYTPLMYAVMNPSPEATRVLLAAGADPDRLNADGDSARAIARKRKAQFSRMVEDEDEQMRQTGAKLLAEIESCRALLER